MVHVIGTDVAYTSSEQTVEIRYSLNDEKRTDFTMKVGESVPLVAVPLNEENESPVVWSMDDVAGQALRFVEDKTDPFKVSLECFGTLPAEYMGCTIEWVSSDEAVITNDGQIISPAEKTKVELTAKITSGEFTMERTYNVTVKPEN